MSVPSFFRLILLAAIWGGSFLFMRIAAPVLGAAWVAEARVALAAFFLGAVALYLGKQLQARTYWRHYLILGLFNSALPFLLFAYAAQTLSVSLMAILNATAPMWGSAIAAISGRQALQGKSILGLVCGGIGVAILVGLDLDGAYGQNLSAVGAALTAAFCYGIASNYAAAAPDVEAYNNAHGNLWASFILLLPVVAFYPLPGIPSTGILSALVALGVLCSGIAYLLYFRLIRDEGATSALTVTFLIPVFGVLWGYMFLNEIIGWHTVFGALIVLTGTMLVTGFSLRSLRK